MDRVCFIEAPAKLNLHLQVGRKRQDGYHEICSLVTMVDLCDKLFISSLKIGNRCEIEGSFDCNTQDNLIYKAWQSYCEASGNKIGIHVRVEKNIPSQAGMGGGSSDAAAVLKALNYLEGNPLRLEQLMEIGAGLGSDIPLFFSSPYSLIKGRGENVKALDFKGIYNILVIQPDVQISTGGAYSKLARTAEYPELFLPDETMIKVLPAAGLYRTSFCNDFLAAVSDGNDIFSNIISNLYAQGACYSNLTGSGSVVFGLFDCEKNAEKAYKALKCEYKFVQKIKSLDRIPYAILE